MYYIGIDIGTSSVKVLAINNKHEIVGTTKRNYPVYYPKDNWAEQDPNDWWDKTLEAMIDLINTYDISADDIESIGLSGQMHGLVALDESSNILFPAILWNDQRTEEECNDIQSYFGRELLREYTGNKALTGFTAPKLLWIKINRPELFARIKHILLPKDYIRYKLTGEYATDVTDASGTLMFNVQKREWSKQVCEYLGIEDSILPRAYESFHVTGKITKEVKKILGTEKDILVVGGAGDQAAGAVGSGTVSDGMVSINLGTSGVVFASHDEYFVDKMCRLHAFCHANGRYHSMGVMLSAASCLKWWSDSIHSNVELGNLIQEAEDVQRKSKLIFLPYLMGERTPYSDPNARGCFLGMDMTTSRGQMTRAILEGVAFGLKDSFEIMKEMGIPIKHVRVIGGGAKSLLWKQILSDVLNSKIEEINTSEGGGLGAAILAAVGAGLYKDVNEGCTKMVKVARIVEPMEKNVEHYSHLYTKYKDSYPRLKEWFI